MWLRENCFRLKLWGELLSSWIWMSKFLPRFGKFSAIISLNKFSASFSFSFPSGTPVVHRLFPLMVFHKSNRLSQFLFVIFSSSEWIISAFNFTDFRVSSVGAYCGPDTGQAWCLFGSDCLGHSINNCVVLGKPCGGICSVEVFSSTSRSSS